MTDPLKLVSDEGVAVWLDDMSRERLVSGNLKALVRDKHVVGVTTNPTIFHKAITSSHVYDEQIANLAALDIPVAEAIRLLTTHDVRAVCDSVAPGLRRDRRPRRAGVDRGRSRSRRRHPANGRRSGVALVDGGPAQPDGQDPGHRGGPSRDHRRVGGGHQRQRHAHLLRRAVRGGHGCLPRRSGAGARRRTGSRPDRVRSPRSSSAGSTPRSTPGWTRSATDEALALRGKAAIANARLAYERFEQVFRTPQRWERLEALDARPQRPLWASTGVKDPALRRHPLRRRARGTGHREHDARGHAACGRRPRGDPRRHRFAAVTARRGG